jgi:hypothetical protein
MTTASGKNRWFQLGVISAGAMAPLIARWRSLRAAEQAEALREQASARWSDAVDWVAQTLPPDALQESLRQAGPQAQDALRRVGPAAVEALRRLPIPTRNVATDTTPPAIIPPTTHRRVNVTLWTLGVGVGLIAAGATAFVVLRNRMIASSDDDALVEIPLTVVTPTDTQTQTDAARASEGPAIVEESADEEPGVAEPTQFSEDDAAGAAYVGNILSRVYHPADSKRLPAPQHRIYFATAEQAMLAGYRADGASSGTRATEPSNHHE